MAAFEKNYVVKAWTNRKDAIGGTAPDLEVRVKAYSQMGALATARKNDPKVGEFNYVTILKED